MPMLRSLPVLAIAGCFAQPDPVIILAEPEFVRNDAIEHVMPLPPDDYPKSLQGILWMDQAGSFGFSNMSARAPELALSAGDTKYAQLDREKRQLNVNTKGPAWQWMNNAEAYGWYNDSWSVHHLEFVYNEDYSFAQIYVVSQLASGGLYRVPESFLSYNMTLQTPSPGQCPPKRGATRGEVSLCALWRRETRRANADDTELYYAFQIVDQQGKRIEPYYSAYVDWANQNSKPDVAAAAKYGFTLGAVGEVNGSSFVGKYNEALHGSLTSLSLIRFVPGLWPCIICVIRVLV